MAKEWANKDKYHPSNGVLEPSVQMPRAKASVRTVEDHVWFEDRWMVTSLCDEWLTTLCGLILG
jgi:hypothetical protein